VSATDSHCFEWDGKPFDLKEINQVVFTSLGDDEPFVVTFTDPLLHEGKQVGVDLGSAITLGTTQDSASFATEAFVFTCNGKTIGTIQVQGEYPALGDTSEFDLAIVGTTGIFRDSHSGYIRSYQSPTGSYLTYTVYLD